MRFLSQSCVLHRYTEAKHIHPFKTRLSDPVSGLSIRITSQTETHSISGVQADAPQQLTRPADTTIFQTPTLSFGEIGYTGEQATTGYPARSHGVGHFASTRLLERTALIHSGLWTTGAGGQLYLADIDKALRLYTRNANVLAQFNYYRSDIELTFRMNTNQFYFGALMATMWPSNETGQRVDERAVLDPTIITASSAESVVKTWNYSFPFAWKKLDDEFQFPVFFSLDIVAPLSLAKTDIPDSITFQIWARFKNIELSYPTGVLTMQSSVRVPKRNRGSHVLDDPQSISGGEVVPSLSHYPISDTIESIARPLEDLWKNISSFSFLFDKPNDDTPNSSMIVDATHDMYVTDLTDTATSYSLAKGRYLDPSPSRMPMSKNWTISDYSRIPGLRGPNNIFVAQNDNATITLVQTHLDATTYKTPLDYSVLSSIMWRGSLKICLQFFTSSFISARFVVQYTNAAEYPGYPVDYTNGISKIINVKGDTVDTITLPWLSSQWWAGDAGVSPQIKITCDSVIANSDTAADPAIYMLCWVSGGDDIQFAVPSTAQTNVWGGPYVSPTPITMQCSIGELFQRNFTPICENNQYDIDTALCTTEQIGDLLSVAKRYSPLTVTDDLLFPASLLDRLPSGSPVDPVSYARYYSFRLTYYGNWRAAFLYRSGGYRARSFNQALPYRISSTSTQVATLYGLSTVNPFDECAKFSIPPVQRGPYCMLTDQVQVQPPVQELSIGPDGVTTTPTSPLFISARDDVQFGYPILPRAFGTPS